MRFLASAALALLLAVSPAAFAADGHDFFQSSLGDLRADLADAKSGGKKGVLVMYEMDDCPFCHRMKTTVLSQPEVQKWFKDRFLILSLKVDGDVALEDFDGKPTTEKAFALAQRVRATPAFVFYGLDGKPAARFTGPTKDAAEFLLLGRYFEEGAWKGKSFAAYKRERGGAGALAEKP